MSIADKITQLQTAKNDIRTAIVNKGVELPDAAGFGSFAGAISGSDLRRFYAVQKNSGSENCSSSQIVFDCPFNPVNIMLSYNNHNFASQQITSGHFMRNAAVYIYKNGSSMGRTQITENVPNYWYYQDGKVYINKVTSSIGWASNNYWFYCIG